MLLEDLQVVLKVAEFRSITAAARHLGMQTATASAAVKRVEQALATQLFIRSTRQLRVSAAGERYLPECEQALQLLKQARLNLQEDQGVVEGELRLSVSSDLGRNLLMPWLDDFIDRYPKLRLKTHISDSTIDFYRDSVDLAFRYGRPKEANLYGFKLCTVPTLLCASPEYLHEFGVPEEPQDLTRHKGLFYQLNDITYDVWSFNHDGKDYRVKMSGDRIANDGDLVRRWCVAGKGMAVKACLDVAGDLLDGRLVSVMPQYRERTIELWLVCPSRQSITPAVRLLRDHVQERCKALIELLTAKGMLQS